MLIIIILVIFTSIIESLPWWTFVVPVLILGMVINFRRWNVSVFSIGFLSGFIIWFGANLYFDTIVSGVILNKLGLLLSVPKIIVLVISGVIGGLLTGLALYTGKNILVYDQVPGLDEKINQ